MKKEDEAFTSLSPKDTFKSGKEFGLSLRGGELILLEGALGSGKTLFTKGIAKALSLSPDNITSPTFSIMNIYENKKGLSLLHVDLYRLGSREEVLDIGLLEYEMPNLITVIEWGLQYKDLFESAKDTMLVTIEIIAFSKRKIRIKTL